MRRKPWSTEWRGWQLPVTERNEWPPCAGERLSREEKMARVGLANWPGLGPLAYRTLLGRFGTVATAAARWADWRAGAPEAASLRRNLLGEPKQTIDWCLAEGERLLAEAERQGVFSVTLGEEGYPPLLPYSASPPPCLWVKGELRQADWRSISIVGTRRASSYGCYQANRLAGEAVRAGFTVVSGLARGVDAAAHRGALEAGGRTIAVFGCGLDRVYPPEHLELALQVVGQGALVSEFPFGVPPNPEHFPRRNRIIAGLTLGTAVVEAGERSGAMNTAHQALDIGREVFAVPGEAGRPGSVGPHELLREGARLAEGAADLLDAFSYLDKAEGRRPHLTPACSVLPVGEADGRESEVLWRALMQGPRRVEELAFLAGVPVGAALAQLVAWELEGKVRSFPDGRKGAVAV